MNEFVIGHTECIAMQFIFVYVIACQFFGMHNTLHIMY